jgi:TonB-dependent starch-binding outer membrane protein SusC
LTVNPFGSAQLPAPGGNITESLNRFLSHFANVAYTYGGRYTVNLSGRQDGANIFGVKTNDRITPLWSAGLGWNISKESFYHIDWLPYLKGRLSYGFNGNVYNGSAYVKGIYTTSSLTGATILTDITAPNPELRWEKVKNINAGLDFAFKNWLSGTIEYYQKNGVDLIQPIQLFSSSGFISFIGNSASTKSHGFDITLNSKNLNGKFKWNSVVLLSTFKDKVTSYAVQPTNNTIRDNGGAGGPSLGRSLYGIYAYKWEGLDGNNGDPQGRLGGKVSKDYLGIINNFKPDSLKYMGSGRPTVFGSFRNDFSYANLSLSINVLYDLGFVFRRGSVSLNEAELISTGSGANADYADRWQKPGDELNTSVPSVIYPNNANRNNFYQYSEALVENGSNIRLQDIRISYDLTNRINSRLPFNRMQVFAYASNLGIIWRANKYGLDPNVRNFNAHRIPVPFNISVGFNIQL